MPNVEREIPWSEKKIVRRAIPWSEEVEIEYNRLNIVKTEAWSILGLEASSIEDAESKALKYVSAEADVKYEDIEGVTCRRLDNGNYNCTVVIHMKKIYKP